MISLRENTAQSKRSSRPGMRALWCLMIAAALACGAVRAEEERVEWSRPEAEQADVRWYLIGGYWRNDRGNEFVLSTHEGLLTASWWKGNSISVMIDRWRVIRRLRPFRLLEHLAVVTDTLWCSAFRKPGEDGEAFHWYREVGVERSSKGERLTAHYALDIHPPDDALTAEIGPMWGTYRDYIRNGDFKIEGPWIRIREEEAPQWFRDLVAQDLIGKPRCQP